MTADTKLLSAVRLVMMRRKMHFSFFHSFFFIFLFILSTFLLTGCYEQNIKETDRLNELSYSFHYRSLDSTRLYAQKAMATAGRYGAGKAEAYNNLAFVCMAEMNYQRAYQLLDSVYMLTDNQIELLIADIGHMRLCQRESHNKEFYDYHEQAQHRIQRINEEEQKLSEHLNRRMIYATSEFYIVTSTYYYYVGLEKPSIQALDKINIEGDIRKDTAQLLAYYYNVGAGGIITEGTQQEICQQEFDYLIYCYELACQEDYSFWIANSLQALSEHLQVKEERVQLINDNYPVIEAINIENMPDSLLAGNLAQRSLQTFEKFGDVYQIAGSYRTLGQCYWQIKDYMSAITCLKNALEKNKQIEQAPDLVASIREQLCVAYSAIGDKQSSDYNRNIYLDLQEQTRQDRYLESRADQLDKSSSQLNIMISSVVMMIVMVVLLIALFDWLRRRNAKKNPIQLLYAPLKEWQRRNEAHMSELESLYEEINEDYALNVIHITNNKKRNMEQRAKVSLVNQITPFIDRMLHEIKRLLNVSESSEVRKERYAYIGELADTINSYNDVLTEWIQLRQGELSLQIESFPLQHLFDIVGKSRMSFQMKGIDLQVDKTDTYVKADKILTLFMINTIADNARKFTDKGGFVKVSATQKSDSVEISVEDNGKGMSPEQLSGIFDHKVYNGHGFGLMNCKGIIEKYKKISPIFKVCNISAVSEEGRGSRFFFNLPKGVVRILIIASLLLSSSFAFAQRTMRDNAPFSLQMAAFFADSVYNCNVNGEYRKTLEYADSCICYLNKYYLEKNPDGRQLMTPDGLGAEEPAEIQWFRDSLKTNYEVILSLRNECAVAALALHEWQLYKYNNKVYTQLFKERSADRRLEEYCKVMQRSETNKNVAIVILVLLLLLLFPAYYFIYYRHRLYEQFCIDRLKRINEILLGDATAEKKMVEINKIASDRFPQELQNIVQEILDSLRVSIERRKASQVSIELMEDERRRAHYEDEKLHISNSVLDNCLSTLKHETMYYPSRIRQLVDGNDENLQSISELATYYKELYTILSSQAMRQVDAIRFECKPVDLSSVVPDAKVSRPISLLGDYDMLKYLFDILQKQNEGKPLDVVCEAKGDKYVDIRVLLDTMRLTQQECKELFVPASDRLPFLLCRQIVRDTGEATHSRGCGITAEPTPLGICLIITLVKTNNN